MTGLLLLTLLLSSCAERYVFNGRVIPDETIAYDIIGVDTKNQPFRLSDQRGRYVLLNFGYTFCPDICPLTLVELKSAYTKLLTQAKVTPEEIVVVFVTVDPARDTLDKLGPYVNAFHPDFYGVYIADEAELEKMLNEYKVVARKRYQPGPNDTVTYLVDHSGGIFVIDPNGVQRLYFAHNLGVDKIVADLAYLLNKRS
jgi:protein SCO1/2